MTRPSPLTVAWSIALLLAGTSYAQSTRPATRPADGGKFMRFVDDGRGGGRLEASVVSYRNARGQQVDLIAAVHVADREYYVDLRNSFEQYDSLLYEMVKPRDMTADELPTTRPRAARTERPTHWVHTLQVFLKSALELSFQLEEIDYTKKNFVHADLDAETFQRMQSDRGESLFTLMLQQMLHELSRAPQRDTPQPGLPELLLALQSPDRARQLKLLLAREFNQMEQMLAGMEGPNGSVLLTERNKAAVRVLKERLAIGEDRIGLFYGAGHLSGIEKMITSELGFKQEGEPKWRTAWNLESR